VMVMVVELYAREMGAREGVGPKPETELLRLDLGRAARNGDGG
jgi:hypothetical protein